MVSTAILKARLSCAVRVHGTLSRGRVEERSDIDEPENWLEIRWLSCGTDLVGQGRQLEVDSPGNWKPM